ncbi:MAG TPA: L,D-transpeptidase family protein [Coriobacteriia bacterium]|nr:L,D-transpeptidase family protein [Coriobacteriia bacterium]
MPRRSRVVTALVLVLTAGALALPAFAHAAGVRFEDDDLRLSYAGAWRSVWMFNASGLSYRVADKPGSTVTATFEGDHASLIGRFGPDRGKLRVLVDGAAVADVDTYNPQRTSQATLWDSGALSAGTHTIAVEALDAKNAAATGSSVVVDAFEINGTPVQGPVPETTIEDSSDQLSRIGSWWVSKRGGASYGRAWRTKSKGASISVRFDGSGVTWFGRKDPEGGLAEVLLDGKRVAKVTQYREAVAEHVAGYSISGLSAGTHTLTVRALGRKGAGGGKKVDVDGFLVNGSPVKAYTPSPFKYKWKRYIVIDKSEFRLYWVKNGILVKTYPVALGRVGMTTPSRVWRVGIKYKTDPRGVYGPRKMRLFKRVNGRFVFTAYGIHGTNQEWVIGTRASHGCIRMYNKDVRELWKQVPVGTIVVTRD